MRLCINIRGIHVVNRFIRAVLLAPVVPALLLSGCSSVKVWPFEGDKTAGRQTGPANATEYQCAGGKRFYVRYLDNGATAWLIYPDREVGLAKAASGTRYSNGVAVLEFSGSEATLTDPPAIAYSGCKAVGK